MNSDVVIQSLREIEDRNGVLTPEAVVKAAKPKDHPLHDRFEWDDRRAGQKHRLHQARQMIRVIYLPSRYKKTIHRLKVYTRAPGLPTHVQGYRRTAELRRQPDEARMALVAEMQRVTSIIERAKTMAIALGLAPKALDEIDGLITEFVRGVRNDDVRRAA